MHIYNLEIIGDSVSASVDLNSFPIHSDVLFENNVQSVLPINQYLVGDNELIIDISPMSDSFKDTAFRLDVKQYSPGGIVGTGDGQLVSSIDLKDLLANDYVSGSVQYKLHFANEEGGFSGLVESLEVLSEEEAKIFTYELHKMLEKKDTQGFFNKGFLAWKHYTQAYGEDYEEFSKFVIEGTKEDLKGTPILSYEEGDLQLVHSRDKKVWVPFRFNTKLPFLITEEDEYQSFTEYPIMIGKVDGEVLVIR